MFGSSHMFGGILAEIQVTLSVNENNPNMVTKFTNAGWNGVSPFIGSIVINAGIIIGSTSTSIAALDLTSTSFPSGTKWKLINNGRIQGKGGDGGSGAQSVPNTSGGNGNSGGIALKINKEIIITNSSGEIWSGGGGGGGGGSGKNIVSGGGGGGGGGGK